MPKAQRAMEIDLARKYSVRVMLSDESNMPRNTTITDVRLAIEAGMSMLGLDIESFAITELD